MAWLRLFAHERAGVRARRIEDIALAGLGSQQNEVMIARNQASRKLFGIGPSEVWLGVNIAFKQRASMSYRPAEQ